MNNEQRVHLFICARPAANRTRPAGHKKPFLGRGREIIVAVFGDYTHQCARGFRRRRPFWIILQCLSFHNIGSYSYAYVQKHYTGCGKKK